MAKRKSSRKSVPKADLDTFDDVTADIAAPEPDPEPIDVAIPDAPPIYVIRYRGVDLVQPLLQSEIDTFEAVEATLAATTVGEPLADEVAEPPVEIIAAEPIDDAPVDEDAEAAENERVQAERIAFKEEQERIAAEQGAEADAETETEAEPVDAEPAEASEPAA